MSIIYSNTTVYGQPVLTSSPCKKRPDTGAPCILLHEPKTNPSCENCAILGRGDCWEPEKYIPDQDVLHDKRLIECKWPGCYDRTRSASGYCINHVGTIKARCKAWNRDHGDDPVPPEWLHRPIDRRRNRYKNEP